MQFSLLSTFQDVYWVLLRPCVENFLLKMLNLAQIVPKTSFFVRKKQNVHEVIFSQSVYDTLHGQTSSKMIVRPILEDHAKKSH